MTYEERIDFSKSSPHINDTDIDFDLGIENIIYVIEVCFLFNLFQLILTHKYGHLYFWCRWLCSEDGPGIEGFQIIGDAIPGSKLLGCGYPVRGTSLCMFQVYIYIYIYAVVSPLQPTL